MENFEKENIESPRPESQGENKERRQKFFVEVGTNANPVPAIGTKEFSENEIYIGLDISPLQAKTASRMPLTSEVAEGRRKGPEVKKNMFFIAADGRHLPLENQTVDELYFGNVFGDPSIAPDFLKGPTAQGRQMAEGLVDEVKRALRPDGKVIVMENNTPANLPFLRRIFLERGFEIKKMVREEERARWPQEIVLYDKIRRSVPGSYLIEFGFKQNQ